MEKRCEWVNENPLMIKYHDEEWGVPCKDDLLLFEYVVLDTFQAGLSWEIMINKRENFRKAFDNFEPEKVQNYDQKKIDELLDNTGIIRNRAKILATINNAKKYFEIQEEFGSFSKYIWGFVDNETIQNHLSEHSDYQPTTPISDAMSKDMKKRGFKFVGSTTLYAFMQAAGLVNDHMTYCPRHNEVKQSNANRSFGA